MRKTTENRCAEPVRKQAKQGSHAWEGDHSTAFKLPVDCSDLSEAGKKLGTGREHKIIQVVA